MYERKRCPSNISESSVICSSSCSQTYLDTNGSVTFAPNLNYTLNCAFDIIQGPDSHFRITNINLKIPCETGSLEIRDGPFENSPLMGRFCDENLNHFPKQNDFLSTENHIVLRYKRNKPMLFLTRSENYTFLQGICA